MLKIPKSYENVLNILNENGFEAYIVGGCVRDLLLGKTPYDYDITTSATPKQIKAIFPKTVDTGIKHGTVTVVQDGIHTEVTTFRTEGDYTDSRRPDSVCFVSDVKLDLARRDFTVNAMCYNPKTGLVDCFNSENDLNNKILRAVGIPDKRFKEDALRIMRLFRFSSTLGFSIESNTLTSALKLSYALKNISRERIAVELIKAINGKQIENFAPIIDCGALGFCGIEKGDFKKIVLLNGSDNLRLYAFLKLTCPNIYFTLLELKLSNEIKRYCQYMDLAVSNQNLSKSGVKSLLSRVDLFIIKDCAQYKKHIENTPCDAIIKIAEDIIQNNEPYKISHLAIDGDDIQALGYSGDKIGKILNHLLEKVIDDPTLNEKNSLINIIKNIGN